MSTYLLKGLRTFMLTSILLLSTMPLFSSTPIQVNAKEQPRNVYISYAINRIFGIDYVAETFEIDFYLQMLWRVDTETLKKKLNSDRKVLKDEMIVDPKYLDWYPVSDFMNAQSVTPHGGENRYLYKNGFILSDVRYKGVFYNRMQLKKFPFDDQNLIILLEDFSKTNKELIFRYGTPFERPEVERDTIMIESKEIFETDLNFSEFRLNQEVNFITTDHLYEYTANRDVYSQAQLILSISRETGFYLSKIISISLLIVIMSWIVFFMGADRIEERSGFSITAFLALIGHNFVTNSVLPKIPYLTIMDYITLGASVLIFLTAIENIVVYLIHVKNKSVRSNNGRVKVKAATIDRICIWVFPALLILLCIYLFFSLSLIQN